MKTRPWLTVYILLALSMGVLSLETPVSTAQDGDSWDIYQEIWTNINYHNLTTFQIKHPVNGSMVSSNQKLNFIVIPFDADEYLYTIDVYKNDILMYTCNQEKAYDLDIYTTNPINQIVTISFRLDGNEVLRLEYLALLLTPSMNEDFTEQWLMLQGEKQNQSLSGSEIVSQKDKAMSEMNLVVVTGVICILFTTIAGLIVIVFKLISMMNAFTGMVMFISSLVWVNGLANIDKTMRSLDVATANDVFVYWSGIVVLTLMFAFSIISYVIGYKIGKSRLNQWKFWGQDIKNRGITEYNTVVHKHHGKYYWMLQNSWDSFKRVFFKKKHELIFKHGDITDTFHIVQAENIPENNDGHKELRAMDEILKSIYSKMAFKVEPKSSIIYSKNKLNKSSKTALIEIANTLEIPTSGSKKEMIEGIILKQKEVKNTKTPIPSKPDNRKYNFEAWKFNEDGGLLRQDTPIIMLDGNPDIVPIYSERDYKDIDENLKEIRQKAETGITESKLEDMESAWKGFRLFRKKKPKPMGHGVLVHLSNANNYDVLHYQAETDYLNLLSKKYTETERKLHQKEIEMEVKTTEKAKEKYLERDKQILALKDRKRGDYNKPKST